MTTSGNRYVLVLEDGTLYNIVDWTFKRLEDASSIEVDIIERSFQAGAEFPGVQRDESKEITYQYNLDRQDESAYRARENELRMKFRQTRYIRDMLNNIETEVLLRENTIAYDDGGFNLGSLNTVTFIQLKPYWEDIEYSIEGDTGAISNETITIINDGYVETPPIITIQAIEAVTRFSIRLLQNNRGIVIYDLQFGTSGLNTYILDNGEGTVELNQIDRKNKVRAGTGPFNLLLGRNDIEITSMGQIIIQIKWKRRYYL
jgi:phage-related protein